MLACQHLSKCSLQSCNKCHQKPALIKIDHSSAPSLQCQYLRNGHSHPIFGCHKHDFLLLIQHNGGTHFNKLIQCISPNYNHNSWLLHQSPLPVKRHYLVVPLPQLWFLSSLSQTLQVRAMKLSYSSNVTKIPLCVKTLHLIGWSYTVVISLSLETVIQPKKESTGSTC